MKFKIKCVILTFITLILAFGVNSSVIYSISADTTANNLQAVEISSVTSVKSIATGYELKGETDNLALFLNASTAEFIVKNKSNGYIWYSNPKNREEDKIAASIYKVEMGATLIVNYFDTNKLEEGKFNTLVECVNENTAKIVDIKNGFRINFYSSYYKVLIPFQVYLENDYLKAEILTKEIKIEDQTLKIISIQMLPYFGAAYQDETGYMFIPDGSGAIIKYNDGKKNIGLYSRPVYGKDLVESPISNDLTTENIKMPVFGLNNGVNSLFAVITEGDEEASINARVNGNKTSYSNVFASFNTLEKIDYELVLNNPTTVFEKGNIKVQKLGVKYFFLSNENSNYSGMARKYNDYLIRNDAFKVKTQKDNALFIDLYAGVKKTKSILGFKVDVVQPLTTPKEAKLIADELKNAGVNNIVMRYNNWNKDELAETIPVNATFTNDLNVEIKKYISEFSSKGVDFYPSVNRFLTFRKAQNLFSTSFDIVTDIAGIPVRRYDYDLGVGKKTGKPFYISKLNVFESNIEKFINSLNKKGFNKFAASDIGNALYSDVGSKVYKKNDIKKEMVQTLQALDNKLQKLLLENPNIYAAKFADDIIYMPTSSSGHDLIDEDVPFMQIALSNIVRYSAEPINQSSDANKAFLKTIETGSMASFVWIYKDAVLLKNSTLDYLYSANYKEWVKTATAEYKELDVISKDTNGSKIYSHNKLENGIYVTKYENGLEVYVNYSDNDYKLKNGDIVKAGGYFVLKAGE